MSILNSNHLFEQADTLILAPAAGPPRQVDLRRAISSAYYAVFHFTLMSLADEFVGVTQRRTIRYGLVYRSVDHRSLKDLCSIVVKGNPNQKYAPHLPQTGLGSHIGVFAAAVMDLQENRHRADYDPRPRYRRSEAQTAIDTGRSGVRRFREADEADRKAFLTLLLCPPR